MHRYENIDWQFEYRRSCARLRAMLEDELPTVMILNEARLLLCAAYDGPWRMIFALVKLQIKSAWRHYTLMRFEWARTRVFRRMPDPVLEIAERVAEEDRAISKMVNEL